MSISAEVRAPGREEVVHAAEIGQIAFNTPGPEPWVSAYSWLADNRGLDYLVVVEAEGELVASLVCSPAYAYFGSDIVPLSAAGGVATLPEHRKHGYAGMMMERAVQVLFENGWHTSALWPFSYNYYRKYGWEVGSEMRKYSLPSSVAAEMWTSDGVRPALEADLPAISLLVSRCASRYNCVSVRDELWWGCMQAIYKFRFDGNDNPRTSRCPWVHESDGQIDGYAYFEIGGEDEQGSVEVKELVADSSRARGAILSRLAQAEVPTINFYAPIDDGFLQEFPNPKQVKTEIQPGFQFRVVDPCAAMDGRSVDPEIRGELSFLVADPVLPAHEFVVEFDGGKAHTSKGAKARALSIDIQTFSQLYCGYMTPQRAFELGRIEADSVECIDLAGNLFGTRIPFRSYLELG